MISRSVANEHRLVCIDDHCLDMNRDLLTSGSCKRKPVDFDKSSNYLERSNTSFTASLNSSVNSFYDSQMLDTYSAPPPIEALMTDHPWQDSHNGTRGRLAKKHNTNDPPGVNAIDHLNNSISESLSFLQASGSVLSIAEDEAISESDDLSNPLAGNTNASIYNDSVASLNIDDLALDGGSAHSSNSGDSNAENQHTSNRSAASARHNGSMRRSTRRFQNYNSSSKRCHDSSMDMLLEDDDGNQEIIRLLQRQAEVLQEQLQEEQETQLLRNNHMSMQLFPKLISPYERSSSNLMRFHMSSPALMYTSDTAELRKMLHSSVRELKAAFKERQHSFTQARGNDKKQQDSLSNSFQQLEMNLAFIEQEDQQVQCVLRATKEQLERRAQEQVNRIAELEGQLREKRLSSNGSGSATALVGATE